jgi:hypothetical protein
VRNAIPAFSGAWRRPERGCVGVGDQPTREHGVSARVFPNRGICPFFVSSVPINPIRLGFLNALRLVPTPTQPRSVACGNVRFDAWSLVLFWILDLGFWSFVAV